VFNKALNVAMEKEKKGGMMQALLLLQLAKVHGYI